MNDLTDDLGRLQTSLGLFVTSGGSSDSQGVTFDPFTSQQLYFQVLGATVLIPY